MAVVVVLLAVGAWFLLLARANELCAVHVVRGSARLVRGKAPARLLDDLADIGGRAGLSGVTLRIVSESGVPRLLPPSGTSEAVQQQLRNAVGQYRLLQFRQGRGPRA